MARLVERVINDRNDPSIEILGVTRIIVLAAFGILRPAGGGTGRHIAP
jgi:hypothetical protein